MKRVIAFTYGVACYAIFFATFLYAIAFIGNFGVARTLDTPVDTPFALALAIDLGLLALFVVQHSGMARPTFKRWWTKIVPQVIERSTYVLFSSLVLILLFWQWRPLGGVIWDIQDPTGQVAIFTAYGFGWALVLFASFLINHFDLFGLRQVYLNLRNKPYRDLPFGTPLLYRIVRHPLYVGWIFVVWASPLMTLAHLVFAVGCTGYILGAIQLEERNLIDALGDDYREYRRNVPMLIPSVKRLFSRRPTNQEASTSAA
jgi:protein-S-isoprenylcysteine O-methyltransferase Ste14